ncbi:MAG: hypothetical protein ACTHJ8_08955 [Mucilaginibacter sp.]
MKKQAKHNNQMIFCIYAADRKGLLGLLLIHFNRRYYDVNSLNVSRTDVSDMIMVTIEAAVPADEATILAEKLKKIIGVYSVVVYPSSTELKKAGFYRLSAEAQNNSFWHTIQRHGAILSFMGEGYMIVQKIGSDDDLDKLYSLLEGPHLTGFCRTALIVEQSLKPIEAIV